MARRWGKARVAVLRATPDTVGERIARLVDLAEARPPSGERAVIATTGHEQSLPGCFTTPWQIDAARVALGGAEAVLAEPTGPSWVRRRIPTAGGGAVEVRPRRAMRVLDSLCPEGIVVPEAWFGAYCCVLPTAACHVDFGLQGALTTGPWPVGARAPRSRGEASAAHVDLWSIRREISPGTLVVLDATTVADGLGPARARPVIKSTLLASTDPVAIDTVAATLMGLEPMSVEAIFLAQEEGLGVADVRDIEVVGDAIDGEDWGLSPRARDLDLMGEALSSSIGIGVPIVDRAVASVRSWARAASGRNRRLRRRWARETPWGRLFARSA